MGFGLWDDVTPTLQRFLRVLNAQNALFQGLSRSTKQKINKSM